MSNIKFYIGKILIITLCVFICRNPYPALAEKVGGPTLKKAIGIMINISLTGETIPYLLIGKLFS